MLPPSQPMVGRVPEALELTLPALLFGAEVGEFVSSKQPKAGPVPSPAYNGPLLSEVAFSLLHKGKKEVVLAYHKSNEVLQSIVLVWEGKAGQGWQMKGKFPTCSAERKAMKREFAFQRGARSKKQSGSSAPFKREFYRIYSNLKHHQI